MVQIITINMSILYKLCFIVGCKCINLHPNRPKFADACRTGVSCPNGNCWYTHPDEWNPIRINEMCRLGNKCRRASCPYIHPENDISLYEKKLVKTCNLGYNCTDENCNMDGHDAPPKMCRFGKECRGTGRYGRFKCQLWHPEPKGVCPFGSSCYRGPSCWFSYHGEVGTVVLPDVDK